MTRAQKIILTIGVIVALGLAGVAVAASRAEPTITPGICLEYGSGRYMDGTRPCRRSTPATVEKAPLQDTTTWWIFGVGAVVVLTGLGLVLARPTVSR